MKIFLACFKGPIHTGLGDELRELSGTDLFKAVRGSIRGIAQNEGEEKPEKSS